MACMRSGSRPVHDDVDAAGQMEAGATHTALPPCRLQVCVRAFVRFVRAPPRELMGMAACEEVPRGARTTAQGIARRVYVFASGRQLFCLHTAESG